ncbi:hypothetical protein UT300005_03730 [Clostridium sp. CTA-5]
MAIMNKQDIELEFFDLLRQGLNIQEFEKWVYNIDEKLLIEYYGYNFYFELISLNYKDKYVMNELEKLLFSKVPFGKFEEIKIKALLEYIIDDREDLIRAIQKLYDLYCCGYNFLRYIGLAYVLNGMPREYEAYIFNEQTKRNLKNEAKRILSFLDAEKIVIMGEYEYKDLREEVDKIELHNIENMYKQEKNVY